MKTRPDTGWRRRARPLLGTLVEIGTRGVEADAAIETAFAAVTDGAACLSRFDPASDIARFHRLTVGDSLLVRRPTADVLAAAQNLREATDGLFDVSLGSAPHGWQIDGDLLVKHEPDVRLDLGGIGKGYLVDAAVQALQACGCRHGWVNAGGDLRAFGDAELPLRLRDECAGGVRAFATLADGAFATSHFGVASRSQAWPPVHAYASVAAPRCLWADALTKVVALSGQARHPALAAFGAQAWLH
jgi:FAD:protein FMN transferase